MQQQTGIAENLKLLADFVADVAVVGMQLFQLAVKGVNVFVLELRLAEATHDVQHVQRPAGFWFRKFLEAFGSHLKTRSNSDLRFNNNCYAVTEAGFSSGSGKPSHASGNEPNL